MQVEPGLWEQYRVYCQRTRLQCVLCRKSGHPCVGCPTERTGAINPKPQFDMMAMQYMFGDRARLYAQEGQPAAEFLKRCGWGPLLPWVHIVGCYVLAVLQCAGGIVRRARVSCAFSTHFAIGRMHGAAFWAVFRFLFLAQPLPQGHRANAEQIAFRRKWNLQDRVPPQPGCDVRFLRTNWFLDEEEDPPRGRTNRFPDEGVDPPRGAPQIAQFGYLNLDGLVTDTAPTALTAAQLRHCYVWPDP